MISSSSRGTTVIAITFLLALILSILPLSIWADIFRPPWLALVLFYWVIALPHRVGLKTAWLLGLVLDGLNGTVLGEHALAMTVLAYLGQKLHLQIRMFPVLQQALAVGFLIILYQLLLIWVQGVIGELADIRWSWLPAVISALLWPWLASLLRNCRRRFQVY